MKPVPGILVERSTENLRQVDTAARNGLNPLPEFRPPHHIRLTKDILLIFIKRQVLDSGRA